MKFLLRKIACWGLDDDGDLALKVGPFVFSFYKYRAPAVLSVKESGWRPFKNDYEAVQRWRYLASYGQGPGYFTGSRAMNNPIDHLIMVDKASSEKGDCTVNITKRRPANPDSSLEFSPRPYKLRIDKETSPKEESEAERIRKTLGSPNFGYDDPDQSKGNDHD